MLKAVMRFPKHPPPHAQADGVVANSIKAVLGYIMSNALLQGSDGGPDPPMIFSHKKRCLSGWLR